MEADVPVLSPRQERFCRYAAFGHTLTEAAKRADDKERETDLRARIEAEASERARAEPTRELAANQPAEPVLSGTFHDVYDEPDAIDLVIAEINGTAVRHNAGTGPTVTDHDFPGLSHRSHAAEGGDS